MGKRRQRMRAVGVLRAQRLAWRRMWPNDCENCGGLAGPGCGVQAECGHWFCDICEGRGRDEQHVHWADPDGTCLPAACVQLGHLFNWLGRSDAEKHEAHVEAIVRCCEDLGASWDALTQRADRVFG